MEPTAGVNVGSSADGRAVAGGGGVNRHLVETEAG